MQEKAETKYPGLVNRKRVIATLEDKANITGFRWSQPDKIQQGFVEKLNEKDDFLYYSLTEPVTICDVDGREKVTKKTSFYKQDYKTSHKQAVIGVWVEGLASTYHGRKSSNWVQEYLTLSEIIEVLNAGFAFAPGLFSPPAGQSARSAEYCKYRQIILFDGDEWTDGCSAPPDLNALLAQYPDMVKDFYWVGESISSRSSLKPELRTRLMLVLPQPILKGQSYLWETAVDTVVGKYPFIARGVGIDKVRISFGNARPECENITLGGLVSDYTFSEWQQIASEKQAKAEALRLENERQKAEHKERREKNNKLKTELVRRGHAVETFTDPLVAFCEVDAAQLLVDLGLASHLSGNAWNWHGSSPGRSFELSDGIIKPFSHSMQSSSPESDSTKPVNAHRFILYYLHNLDISKDNDKRELRCLLADSGHGTHPDTYKQAKRTEKIAAVREGLISPLELRSAAKPLPKERTDRVLQTLEDNAPMIENAFRENARVVGLRAGTGEGKTEGAISLAVDGRAVAMSLNTTLLAEQVYSRFDAAETHAFLWRSRWFGYGNSEIERKKVNLIPLRERIRKFEQGDVFCIKPHLCKASQDRGVPAPVAVCHTCEVRDKCVEKRYLSQTQTAQKSQVLCIVSPKLFIDPLHRGFFRQISKGQPSDRVCVIDEAKAHELFIDCSLSKAVLQQWVKDWAGESLGDFADKTIDLLEKDRDFYAVAELVDSLTDNEIKELSRQASRYRVPYKVVNRQLANKDRGNLLADCALRFENGKVVYVPVHREAYDTLRDRRISVIQPLKEFETEAEERNRRRTGEGYLTLTPTQAFALGIYNPTNLNDIEALPRLWEQSNWTPFQQLKTFIARYKRKVDAPIWYSDGVLHWVIPPVVHSRVKRLVCMSATLQKEGLERAFDSIDRKKITFIETPPTLLVDGAWSFQVRTGGYPRGSLLEYNTDWQPVGLNKTGKYFLELIETEVERDRAVRHVLITFNFIAEKYGKELTEKHSNLDVLSFHKMEGLDYTESGIVFWVLGCPDVSNAVVEQRARVLFGNDTKPLDYEYVKGEGYTDRRLQACWESEVAARLRQAVGRARLNRLANTVVVFSNVLIPDFTGRAVGFVPEDLEVAGGLANLTETANARMAAESKAKQKTGYKTARQREKEVRDLKAKQKRTALKLHNAGVSPDEIASRVGVDRRTIFRWVKDAKS